MVWDSYYSIEQGDVAGELEDLKLHLKDADEQFLQIADYIHPPLHKYCARTTGSVFDGVDVVQDTFAQVYYKLSMLRQGVPLKPWLFRIAHNKCVDFLRSHRGAVRAAAREIRSTVGRYGQKRRRTESPRSRRNCWGSLVVFNHVAAAQRTGPRYPQGHPWLLHEGNCRNPWYRSRGGEGRPPSGTAETALAHPFSRSSSRTRARQNIRNSRDVTSSFLTVEPEARISEPASGYIADIDTWQGLWLAWRGDVEPPEIDFQSSLILVGTVPGPNRAGLQVHADSAGNIQIVVGGTRIRGPGFGYIFAKVQRTGIPAVNGKAVAPVGKTCCPGTCSAPVEEQR